MSDIQLLGGYYRSAPTAFAPPRAGVEERITLLANAISDALNEALDELDGDAFDLNVVSTTVITSFSNEVGLTNELLSQIRRHVRHAPQTVVNSYECAGWGGVLRYACQAWPVVRSAACIIVDLNVSDLEFWLHRSDWGASGFGISVLQFALSENAGRHISVGVAKSDNRMAEFALALRRHLAARPNSTPVALPFLPANISDMFDRAIPGMNRLPDLHHRLGHCFGSDPWISILEHEASIRAIGLPVLATSVSLSGYWVLADISVHPDARFQLELGR
jgi:hypothetical protein